MTRKPTPTAWEIFMNSRRSAIEEFSSRLLLAHQKEVHTLGASVNELGAIFEEILGDIH
jgi:hypothetical protein